MTDRRGLALIIVAAALWGTTGTAQALGPADAEPIAVGVARLLLAAPALLVIARPRRVPREDLLLILIAGAGMAAYQPLFFSAVEAAGVAVGTVVAIGSAPLLAGALGWVVDGHRPSRPWWIATMLGIAGVGSTSLAGVSDASPAGVALALGAGLSFAVYLIASRRVVVRSSPVSSMALIFTAAATLSLLVLPWVDLGWVATGSGLIMELHLGLIATALAYVLFSLGLRTTTAATAATASLFEPVTAGLLGVLVLGETPGVGGWIGIALILGSTALLATSMPSVRTAAH